MGKSPVTPLKASSLGDDASLKKFETILASSPEKIKSANLHKMTLHHVEEALIEALSEEELCKRLKPHHIDLFLRRNATTESPASHSSITRIAVCSMVPDSGKGTRQTLQ